VSLRLLPLLLALALPARAASAPVPKASAESPDDEDGKEPPDEDEAKGEHKLELGLRGSRGREANTRDYEWGPTLSYEIMQSRKEKSSRFKYELEASYNDAASASRSGDTSQSTRVRTAEFRYAKVSMLELAGFDLKKKLGVVPYVAGGVQHVDSREDSSSPDEEAGGLVSTTSRDRYWSPTFGCGVEVSVNKKVTLALDYNQNVANGDRRVSRLSFELKFAVFGAD
jgi:opacity protein-like surface antigen